jgi:hypothetical protein
MRRAQGYATITSPEGPVVERDTVQCGHCQRIIFVKPGTVATVYLILGSNGRWREEPGAGCALCRRPVCLSCYTIGTCTPWEDMLAQAEGHPSRRPLPILTR